MAKKIRVLDQNGKPIMVDPELLRQGRLRHSTLPDSLLQRIRVVHDRLKDTYDLTLEQWELTIMRDADPVGEVAVWESIAAAFDIAVEQLPEWDRQMILRTMIAYSGGFLTPDELADSKVQRLVGIYDGKEK